MIILGIILILLGLIISSLHWLLIIGVILLIVGLVLNFVPIGGSRTALLLAGPRSAALLRSGCTSSPVGHRSARHSGGG